MLQPSRKVVSRPVATPLQVAPAPAPVPTRAEPEPQEEQVQEIPPKPSEAVSPVVVPRSSDAVIRRIEPDPILVHDSTGLRDVHGPTDLAVPLAGVPGAGHAHTVHLDFSLNQAKPVVLPSERRTTRNPLLDTAKRSVAKPGHWGPPTVSEVDSDSGDSFDGCVSATIQPEITQSGGISSDDEPLPEQVLYPEVDAFALLPAGANIDVDSSSHEEESESEYESECGDPSAILGDANLQTSPFTCPNTGDRLLLPPPHVLLLDGAWSGGQGGSAKISDAMAALDHEKQQDIQKPSFPPRAAIPLGQNNEINQEQAPAAITQQKQKQNLNAFLAASRKPGHTSVHLHDYNPDDISDSDFPAVIAASGDVAGVVDGCYDMHSLYVPLDTTKISPLPQPKTDSKPSSVLSSEKQHRLECWQALLANIERRIPILSEMWDKDRAVNHQGEYEKHRVKLGEIMLQQYTDRKTRVEFYISCLQNNGYPPGEEPIHQDLVGDPEQDRVALSTDLTLSRRYLATSLQSGLKPEDVVVLHVPPGDFDPRAGLEHWQAWHQHLAEWRWKDRIRQDIVGTLRKAFVDTRTVHSQGKKQKQQKQAAAVKTVVVDEQHATRAFRIFKREFATWMRRVRRRYPQKSDQEIHDHVMKKQNVDYLKFYKDLEEGVGSAALQEAASHSQGKSHTVQPEPLEQHEEPQGQDVDGSALNAFLKMVGECHDQEQSGGLLQQGDLLYAHDGETMERMRKVLMSGVVSDARAAASSARRTSPQVLLHQRSLDIFVEGAHDLRLCEQWSKSKRAYCTAIVDEVFAGLNMEQRAGSNGIPANDNQAIDIQPSEQQDSSDEEQKETNDVKTPRGLYIQIHQVEGLPKRQRTAHLNRFDGLHDIKHVAFEHMCDFLAIVEECRLHFPEAIWLQINGIMSRLTTNGFTMFLSQLEDFDLVDTIESWTHDQFFEWMLVFSELPISVLYDHCCYDGTDSHDRFHTCSLHGQVLPYKFHNIKVCIFYCKNT